MRRIGMCLFAIAIGCQNEPPPPAPAPPAAPAPLPPAPAAPPPTAATPTPPLPSTPTLTDAVAPGASDPGPVAIAEAVKGLKGKGPLYAKIDVETKGLTGTFHCELYEEQAPVTVANFVALARGMRAFKDSKSGQWIKKPFYDGLVFHRVIPEFMIQGGDPDGNGRGGPGYEFDDEIKPELALDKGGILAMANKGINRMTGHGTNGSQFFITEAGTPWLNGKHTVFGLCDNVDLEKKLARVPSTPPANRPLADVVIKKVTIQRGKK
jgi:peptidyl-prolyl cis-trans isomerase A (cyclophilin A)